MDKEIEIYRFKIIEPFLKKEKKLKEIEKEQNISYATLKRWVQAYKKNGMLGLEKKTREDKDSFRNVDDTHLKKIEKLCSETTETNITKLYRHYKKKITKDLSISYATFYRIVNNIDAFFNKDTIMYLDKIKKEHQCYILLDIPLYIFANREDKKDIIPQLLIILDVASLKPIHFMINSDAASLNVILNFIRETLIKTTILTGKKLFPEDILVASQEISNKQLLKEIYQETGIRIYEHYTENSEIAKFVEFIKADIQSFYDENNKNITIDELSGFLSSYLYIQERDYAFSPNIKLLENSKLLRKLDIFLQTATRKINDSKVRLRNLQYTNEYFSGMNGQSVTVKYPVIDDRIIYIFHKDRYLFPAYLLK